MDEQPAAARTPAHSHHPPVGHVPGRDRGVQQVPPLRLRRLPLPLEARPAGQEGLSGHPSFHPERAHGQVERQGHQPVGGRGVQVKVHVCGRPQPSAGLQDQDDLVIPPHSTPTCDSVQSTQTYAPPGSTVYMYVYFCIEYIYIYCTYTAYMI